MAKKRNTKIKLGKGRPIRAPYRRGSYANNTVGIHGYKDTFQIILDKPYASMNWLDFLEGMAGVGFKFDCYYNFCIIFNDMSITITLEEIEKKAFDNQVEKLKNEE